MDDRPVRNLLLSQLLGRSPAATMTIALSVFVLDQYDDIALAGTVIAIYTIGACAAGPVTTGLVARFDSRVALSTVAVLWATALCALALIGPSSRVSLCVLALVVGLLLPPVGPVVRSMYPRLVEPGRVSTLIALDSSMGESMWVFGPLLVAIAQHFFGVRVALVLVAALALAGVILVVGNGAFRSHSGPEPQRGRMLTVLGRVQLWPLMIGVVGLMAGWGAAEIALVARLDNSLHLGAFFALMAVAGAVSSVVWGRYPIGPSSMAVRAAVAALGMGLALLDLGMWWVAAAMALASAGATPTLAAIFTLTVRVVPATQSAVAFGWLATAQLAGMSLGAFVAGRAIDHFQNWRYGVAAALAMFVLSATAGLMVLMSGRRAKRKAATAEAVRAERW
nr:MFS transporter [Nocardioides eburneiflavus]